MAGKKSRSAAEVIDISPRQSDVIRADKTPITPRTANQEDYIEAIRTKCLIFATGEAGCGKTFIAAAKAAEYLSDKAVERIIVTRPVLNADEDLGFLPGGIADKFDPYFRPVKDTLLRRLGETHFKYCMEHGKIEIAPFAYMRGRSFENAFIILDEAQNVTPKQMKLFLTRIGENCIVVVNGDITQCDLPAGHVDGLSDALRRFPDDTDDVAAILFHKEDCVRSHICRLALNAYE